MSGPLGINWDAWPLGLFSDGLIAANVGCTSVAVFHARKTRGIASCRWRRCVPERWDFDTWPLGLVQDKLIAENIGCDISTVGLARKRRGIAPFIQRRQRCNREALRSVVGTRTDKEVAAETGLTEGQVATARRSLKIKSTRIDWSQAPLGSAPDAVIAATYGVGHTVVAGARWRRGIAKWTERRTCACLKTFVAAARRQRFCSRRCASQWWWSFTTNGSALLADLSLALHGLQRSIKEKT